MAELHIKFAWQEDATSGSSAHFTPSTDGISILYIPYLSVVLFTETVICSFVLAESALKVQSILTSAPGDIQGSKWHDLFCKKKKLKSNQVLRLFTCHEVAVSGKAVVGAGVTVNKAHHSDMGAGLPWHSGLCWLSFQNGREQA